MLLRFDYFNHSPGDYVSLICTPRATPSPIQDGMAMGCDDFYEVKRGDVCGEIAKRYSISGDIDFLKRDPAVKKDCTGLLEEIYVCVRGK